MAPSGVGATLGNGFSTVSLEINKKDRAVSGPAFALGIAVYTIPDS
jgi:hypothetical protein